jgi:cobalt-zinc-cadmium efflux system outer membrane protein
MFLQQFGTLAALAGKPELPPAPLKGNLESFPVIDADHVIEQITQNSPSVKRAEQDISRAEAELKSSRRESIPDLQVRAGLENNFEPINEITQRRVGMQGFVTAGVTLPIFNRNQGNVAAATADLERARAEVNRVRLSLRQGTQPVVQDYLTSQEEAARYKTEMIPRATKAYKLYLAKYQNMGAAYPEVIVSQRTLFQFQVAYIGVLEQLWRNAISLQNFMLSNGLSAPQPSGRASTSVNLPSLSSGGVQ